MSTAALAMHDWPEVQWANDALWAFIAARLEGAGIAAPERLDRSQSYSAPWRDPELLLAQTCGYPFATALRGTVRLVGTPCYGAPGCQGADYSSVIITSRASGIGSLGGLRHACAAINALESQSGYWALRSAIAATPGAVPPMCALVTGGHRESLRAVAAERAGVAAIDAVSWALAARHEREAVAAVRVIGASPAAPGLPLISSLATPQQILATLRQALSDAITEPSLGQAREALLLSDFAVLPEATYDRILELSRAALALPFPVLEG